MNDMITPGALQPFTNVPASDADHLLYLIEEAHKPFRQPVLTIGDIATEWVARWRRAQPKTERQVGSVLNSATVGMMRDAFAKSVGVGGSAQPLGFSFDEAAEIIGTRWPGIRIGEPERVWARLPVIAELRRLRFAVQQTDDTRMPEGSATYRNLAPIIG